jgi:hypothetical protein
MEVSMKIKLIFLVGLSVLFVSTSVASSNMVLYSKFRTVALKKGWKPNVAYGVKEVTGYPEVLCGVGPDAICSAEFSDGAGKMRNISVGWDKRKKSKTVGKLITSMSDLR